jgi:hypothetical protein
MDPPPPLTDEVFSAFLKCRYKAYLKLRGEAGEKSDYETFQAGLAADYRAAATEDLLRRHAGAAAVQGPASLPDALRSGPSGAAECEFRRWGRLERGGPPSRSWLPL